MNGNRLFTLLVLLVSLFVAGMLTASLGTAVQSSPDDAIDISYSSLPLSESDGSQLKEAFQRSGGSSDRQRAPRASAAGDRNEPAMPSDPGEGPRSGSQPGDGSMDGGGNQDFIDRLLELLRQLLPVIVGLLVLGALALAVHRAGGLRASLRSVLERLGVIAAVAALLDWRESAGVHSSDNRRLVEPSTGVEWAWQKMRRRANVSAGSNATPRQVAAAVAERCGDGVAVDELTTLFETVRYGNESETPDRAREALTYLNRISVEGGR